MRTRETEVAPLVNLAEITEIELLVLKRMRELTPGEHRSRGHGSGFDFVGLREWQAGDRFSSIDWAQSTLTNFSPLVVREFEQPSTATVVALADRSLSTRFGLDGVSIGATVARALATIGMSAVFFQDPFGLLTFDHDFEQLSGLRPRTGKGHVVHCIDAYQHGRGMLEIRPGSSVETTLDGYLRSRSLVPVLSDFLFDNSTVLLRELALLNGTHDVFIVLIDSAFAFELPPLSAGWVEVADAETGRARTVSRRALARMADAVREHQASVTGIAKDLGLDVVRLGRDQTQSDIALSEFVAERRLRKTGD